MSTCQHGMTRSTTSDRSLKTITAMTADKINKISACSTSTALNTTDRLYDILGGIKLPSRRTWAVHLKWRACKRTRKRLSFNQCRCYSNRAYMIEYAT